MHMRNAIRLVGLAMGLGLSACGETGGGAEAFVGTWHPTSGTIRRACPGSLPTTEDVVQDVVWSAGVETDLVATTVLTPCRLKAEVVVGIAVGIPDDKCTVDDGMGVSTVLVNRYAFVMSPDGRAATESAAGQLTRVADGVATGCSFEATASYQKMGEWHAIRSNSGEACPKHGHAVETTSNGESTCATR
jgi:hypothetical protein